MYKPILYVAEIGSNHMRDFKRAKELIQAAAEAGAGAVKFQLFKAHLLDSRKSVQEKLKQFELPKEWLFDLSKEAHAYDMEFIVTPFDIESCRALKGYVDQVKISAYDLTYLDLICEASRLGVPMVISAAMGSREEIKDARRAAFPMPVIFLHGVAAYPAASAAYSIPKLYELLKTGAAGISDHTLTSEFLMRAAQLPIVMAEKHFRQYTTPKESPDYAVSLAANQFEAYIIDGNASRERAIESLNRGPLKEEMQLYKTCRRTNDKTLRG